MQTNSTESARSLRNLYFVRTVFQVIWAAAVLSTARTQPHVASILLIAYPLWDVACTLYDLLASHTTGSARTSQVINALLGSATALGIALTVFANRLIPLRSSVHGHSAPACFSSSLGSSAVSNSVDNGR
jgi:hypothetical protein